MWRSRLPASGPGAGPVGIWGDGAVGIGLAAALSADLELVLVGPAGSPDADTPVEATGAAEGRRIVRHVPAERAPTCSVVVMAVKATDLAGASAMSRRAGNGSHVCLCNGMGLEDAWGPGWDSVEKAVVLGGFERTGRGSVTIHPGGLIVLAGGLMQSVLEGSRIETDQRPPAALEVARWAKWLVNSSLNPVAALSSLRNDELRPAGLSPLVYGILEEIAPAVPRPMREEAVEDARGMLGFLLDSSHNRASMLQDLDAGRRTEIDFMTGLAERVLPGACPAASAVAALVRARPVRVR